MNDNKNKCVKQINKTDNIKQINSYYSTSSVWNA